MASLFTRLTRRCRFSTSSILSPDSKTPLSSISKTRAALSFLKSEQNPDRILEICRAASLTPDLHIDRVAFSLAISSLSRSNNFSYIQQFLDELRSSRTDLNPERFAAHSIVLFGQANMFDHAIRTFKEFHDLDRNVNDSEGSKKPGSVKCLNSLIFAAILSKNYSEANRVFVSFTNAYNIEPVLDTYNLVIKAFCESKSSSSAYSILAEMDKKGVKPNSVTFGYLITGFYSEDKYNDVEKVLTVMNDEYGIRPGVGPYNLRILSLCKLNKSRDAKALLEEMLEKGIKPNPVTYSHLIRGFCKEGDLEEAKRLFTGIARTDAECYFTMVYYLCQGKDFVSALSICKESIRKGWVPNFTCMKLLVDGLASMGKLEEAKKLSGLMKQKFTKNVKLWEEIEAALPQYGTSK